jgi:hypothetical protein
MGTTHSIIVEDVLSKTRLINPSHEVDIIKQASKCPGVSYGVMMTVVDNQILKFEKHVDAVGSFQSLTVNIKIDVLIDGKIEYQDIKDLTLVLLGCQMKTITIRTYTSDPVIITCTGYTLCSEYFQQMAFKKIKTKTHRYHCGIAKKINTTY